MLRFIRHGQRWIVGTVIVFVGAVFVFFMGSGGPLGPGAATAVVEVDGLRFDVRDHARVRAQQERYYRDTLGDAFESLGAGDQLDSLAAGVLVQRAILARAAELVGLRVSEKEMVQVVRGRFPDADQYQNYVRYEFGTESSYLRSLRMDLLVQKMVHLLTANVRISESEARDAVLHREEEIRLAIVALDPANAPVAPAPSEDQIGEFIAAHPERLQSAYEGRADEFQREERVRARHILIKLDPEATPEAEAEARERVERALARLRADEDFAAVAGELSEDAGTRNAGGDLGFFGRGQMVAAFEEAAFALEPGVLSEPVRSPFGFHVLRVEEREAATTRQLEDVRDELARDLLTREAAERWVGETTERLAEAIRGEGRSLEEAARTEGLTIDRTAMLRRRADGFIPGVGSSPELLRAGFTLTLNAPSSDRIFEVGSKRALVQLLERSAPDEATLAERLPAELERLRDLKQRQLQSGWVDSRRADLERNGRLQVNLAALQRF